MTYPTIDQYNLSNGMGQIFVYAQGVVPFFDALVFGFILVVLTFGMYFTQEIKKGRGDFPVAFSVGCFATTILAGIMQMVTGFVQTGTLGVLISVTIVSFIWLFYSDP